MWVNLLRLKRLRLSEIQNKANSLCKIQGGSCRLSPASTSQDRLTQLHGTQASKSRHYTNDGKRNCNGPSPSHLMRFPFQSIYMEVRRKIKARRLLASSVTVARILSAVVNCSKNCVHVVHGLPGHDRISTKGDTQHVHIADQDAGNGNEPILV